MNNERRFFYLRSVPRVALAEWGCYNFFMYYRYILQLKGKSFYHGFSEDLKQRLNDHHSGTVNSTKNLRPIKLVFYAAFTSKTKALAFEKYLKSSSGAAFRNKHLL
jgi:putative endonuclease